MIVGLATPRARPLEDSPRFVGGDAPPRSNGAGLTLGERLELVLDAARADASGECPVCGGSMVPRAGVAVCSHCGARLG